MESTPHNSTNSIDQYTEGVTKEFRRALAEIAQDGVKFLLSDTVFEILRRPALVLREALAANPEVRSRLKEIGGTGVGILIDLVIDGDYKPESIAKAIAVGALTEAVDLALEHTVDPTTLKRVEFAVGEATGKAIEKLIPIIGESLGKSSLWEPLTYAWYQAGKAYEAHEGPVGAPANAKTAAEAARQSSTTNQDRQVVALAPPTADGIDAVPLTALRAAARTNGSEPKPPVLSGIAVVPLIELTTAPAAGGDVAVVPLVGPPDPVATAGGDVAVVPLVGPPDPVATAGGDVAVVPLVGPPDPVATAGGDVAVVPLVGPPDPVATAGGDVAVVPLVGPPDPVATAGGDVAVVPLVGPPDPVATAGGDVAVVPLVGPPDPVATAGGDVAVVPLVGPPDPVATAGGDVAVVPLVGPPDPVATAGGDVAVVPSSDRRTPWQRLVATLPWSPSSDRRTLWQRLVG